MRFNRVVNVIALGLLASWATPASAKVTYDGTGGVYANIFNNNTVKACTDCHATGQAYEVYAKFDVYSNGVDGAYEKGSTASTYVEYDIMPYNDDSATNVTPLTQSEKDLIAAWVADGRVQNSAPTPTTDSASSISKTGATLNGAVDPSDKDVTYIAFSWGTTASYPHGNTVNITGNYTINGSGNGVSTDVTTSISSLTCGTTYYYSVVATNGNGTDESSVQNFTTTACNQGPTISTSSLPDGAEDTLYQQTISATDPEGDDITYSLNGEPDGMSIGSSSGTISWTPDQSESGQTYNFDVIATDSGADENGSDTVNLSLTINLVNDAPSITSTAGTAATEDVEYQYQVVVDDPDDSNNGTDLSFSLSNEPDNMTVSSTGLISWTPVEGDTSPSNIVITVTDGDEDSAGDGQETFSITVTPVNDPPVYTSSDVTSATEDVAYSYDVDATDEENDSLTFSLTTKPTGMTINSTSGLISWTPDKDQLGSNSVTVSVTDGNNTAVTRSFNITVAETNDTPVIGSSEVTAATESSAYSYDVNATDEESDSITYDLTVFPANMTIDDTTGVISWTPPEAYADYDEDVTVTASDGNTTASQSFTITVSADNDTPDISAIADDNATESASYTFQVTASDLEGDSLNYSLTDKPTDMSIDSDGLISWTPPEAVADYDVNVEVSVSDGNTSATESYTITVAADNDAPSFTNAGTTVATEDEAYSYTATASDPESESLNFALVSGPTGMTVGSDSGEVSWTPPQAGSDYSEDVTISVTDNTNTAVQQSFTINVSSDNDAPEISLISDDSATESIAYSLQVNASDPEGDGLNYSLTTKPTGMTIDDNGLITWTPPEAQSGYSESVTVEVSDGNLTDEDTFVINVSADNDAPIFSSSAITTAEEDVQYTYALTATDIDTDSNNLTYSLTNEPDGMSLSGNVLSWTPPQVKSGYSTNQITLTVVDDDNNSDQQQFSIAVSADNDAPVFSSTEVTSATESQAYTYQLTATDVDSEQNELNFNLDSGPVDMVLSSGVLSWTPPEAGASYTETVQVSVTDDDNNQALQNFTINVSADDDAPVFTTSGQSSAQESVLYQYDANASDNETAEDSLTFALAIAPDNMTIDATSGLISWTPPDADDNYVETVEVTVSDGNSTTSQNYQITVIADADTPIITSSATTAAEEDIAYSYLPTAADEQGDTLTFTLETGPVDMSIDSATGQLDWLPPQALADYTQDIEIKVSDGAFSSTQTFTINISADNDVPVVQSVAEQSVVENQSFLYQLDAIDPEGESLSYQVSVAPDDMVVDGSGVLTWTAEPSLVAYTESITVNVSDGTGFSAVSFDLQVSVVNDPPLIVSSPEVTATEDVNYRYELSVDDPDDANDGSELLYQLLQAPTGMEIDEFGVIEWTPEEGQDGEHTVEVQVSDGGEDDVLPDSQTFVIDVTAVNDAPEISSSAVTNAVQYQEYQYQLEVTDPDDTTDQLTFELLQGPDDMTVSTVGLISWTPGLDAEDETEVEIQVSDGGEDDAQPVTQSFVITLGAVNLAPELSDIDDQAATEDVEFSLQLEVTDLDDNNDGTSLNYELGNAPDGMTVSDTGLISWTPEEGVLEAEDIEVSVTDSGGNEDSTVFSITVTAVNDSPVITSEPVTAAVEAQEYVYQLTITDPDDDNDGAALNFELTRDTNVELSNEPEISSTGQITWTPAEGETLSGEFTVTVTDGGEDNATSDSQTFEIVVTQVNQGPSLAAVTLLSATEDESYSYQLDVSDPDDQNDGESLSFTLANEPSGMSVSDIGVINWTPENGIESSGEVTITVFDGGEDGADVSLQTFEIFVTAVNDAPTFESEPVSTATEDELYIYDVEVDDIDNADDELTLVLMQGPESMTLVDGELAWTPVQDEGDAEIVLLVQDGELEAQQSFVISVTSVNDAPVFDSDPILVATEDVEYVYPVTVSDEDGDDLSLSLIAGPSSMLLEQGELIWTPVQGQETANVVLSLTDGEESTSQSFEIIVTPVNDAPVLSALTDEVMIELQNLTKQVLVTDVDSQQFIYSLSGQPEGMTISSNGLIQWSSGEFSRGDYLVTVTVDDGGDSDNLSSTSFALTVNIIDDDEDLVANYEDNCPAIANTQQADFDADGSGDACDSDDDGDGMSDELEISFGLDPNDSDDADLDLDGDGLTNLEEVQICEAAGDSSCGTLAIDSVPPVINVDSAEVTVTATGYLTEVILTASAEDLVDGEVTPTLSDIGPYRPGTHELTWTARDSEANSITASQTLHVLPLVRLDGTQVVGESQSVTVDVTLNGEAPNYPVVIGYEVAGTATSDDMTLVSGSVEVAEGTSAQLQFDVLTDELIEADETVVITLTEVTGSAVLVDEQQSRTITIVDRNVAPELEVLVSQQELQGTTVYRDQGLVAVSASAFDANNDDLVITFTPEVAVTNEQLQEGVFQFDPTELAGSTFNVLVSVSDGTTTTNNDIQILVLEALPVLSDVVDSDNDGISDAEEGVTDSDNDRVPDYLDSVDDPTLLATNTDGDEQALMQTTDGLQLALGDTAASTQTGDALLSTEDVTDENGQMVEDESFSIVGGVYDFEVSGLNDVTRIAQVVIPLTQAIPENAVYRKFDGSVWLDFVEDADNALASTRKVDGQCPAADSDAYTEGLTAFDDCIRLTLSDGGPNDADGEVNGVIKDPGGIAVANVALDVNLGSDTLEVPTEQPKGGSGAMGQTSIMVILSLWLIRRRKWLGVK